MKHLDMRTLSKRLVLLGIAALFCLPISSLAKIDDTAAANDTIWDLSKQCDNRGPGMRTGYFTGVCDTRSLNGDGYVLEGGIPDYIDTKQEYIDYIWSVYNNEDPNNWRNRVGASFIIHSMLGHKQPRGSIHVSVEDYTEWSTRINSPNILVDFHVWDTCLTSDTYMSSSIDVARAEKQGSCGTLIYFTQVGNPTPLYILARQCANPDGIVNGLPSIPPPPPFTLTPQISINPSTGVEAGQNVQATISVNSEGGGTSSGTKWELTRFIVPPAGTYPGGQTENDTAPKDHYGNSANTPQSSGGTNFSPGVSSLGSYDYATEDRPVGTQICYALSVQPYTSVGGSTKWRHSAPVCVAIAKKPKVQVLGGDLIVGRGINGAAGATSTVQTSVTNNGSGKYYGSWSEYGIVPSGWVAGMASGSGYVGGAPTKDLCALSYLTIANRQPGYCSGTQIGGHVHVSGAPNIAARFSVSPSTPKTPASNNFNLNTLSGLYTTNSSAITVSGGGPIVAGKWVVINAPDTTVTIANNINYTTAAMTSITAIPQVVIIAKNIIIADNVTTIDSWLVTTGTGGDGRINTCGAGGVSETTSLSAGKCGNKLTVNGPIVSNHLLLRRTAGAGTGTSAGNPAEVFNLRADAYIWATAYNQGGGRIPTVSTKELPPRF